MGPLGFSLLLTHTYTHTVIHPLRICSSLAPSLATPKAYTPWGPPPVSPHAFLPKNPSTVRDFSSTSVLPVDRPIVLHMEEGAVAEKRASH